MSNLGQVLRNLESTKVTERQEGLSGIRTAFSKNSFLRTFHLGEDGQTEDRNWILVFNALFTMVRMEKAEYSKSLGKGTQPKPAVVKRLTDVASTVRWLVEKAVAYFGKDAMGQVLHHLRDGVVLRMELLTPIALDYAKAIKCILSFRPHLEHIDDEDWIRLVALAFNVVLGDPPRESLEENIEWAVESENEFSALKEEDEEDSYDELPSVQGKRKRGKSKTPSGSIKPKAKSRSSKTIRQISVSLEQVEFVTILSMLLSYTGAPILSPQFPYLPQAILTRLQRFLSLYPADSSLLHDYLLALSATLDHLALNRVKDTQKFARIVWEDLIGLWNTKDKRMKECLIIVIRSLLPYLTADFGMNSVRDSYDQVGALWKLYSTLEGEAEQRRGVEGLMLDSLRLDITTQVTGTQTTEPFIAHTFRAGWSFDTGQAVSWAVLETQADCAAMLYQLSESMNSGATPLPLKGDKKRKLDNGVSSIISGIQGGTSQHARVFNLQVLLFLIDRHWLSIHHSLKLTVVEFLVQLVTSEDTLVQNWTFLSLAAIVHGERFLAKARDSISTSQSLQSQSQVAYETATWDSLWTHSIRRVNAPVTCRAAAHAAYTLIFQSPESLSIPLPSQRILFEIETLASDLEVQGPSLPYDSVCNFLSQCIRLANQDARLYRIHLEDKVIGWMLDHWKVVGVTKIRTIPQTLQDSVNLLQAVCNLTRQSFLVSRSMLPSCNVTAVTRRESAERNIRDFLLSAKLPLPSPRVTSKATDGSPPSSDKEINVGVGVNDLTPPQARQRKISAFFLRSIDLLTDEWENIIASRTSVTADAARQSLELALVSLVFESLLVYNGIAANRHLVQASTKMISCIVQLLHGSTWNTIEKATVLYTLEPLVLLDDDEEDLEAPTWETMLPPGASSGIKKHVFYKLADELNVLSKPSKERRINLLRIIWQLPDAENHLRDVITRLRKLFSALIAGRASASIGALGVETDERDGFGPVRLVASQTSSTQVGTSGNDAYLLRTLEVCMRFVAAGPLFQSISGEPTRDTDVIDAILDCRAKNANGFLNGFFLLLAEIRRRTFGLGNNLQRYLDALDYFFESYDYEQSERMQQVVSHFLHSILEPWLNSAEIRDQVAALPKWLLKRHKKGKAKYRTERDAFIRFVDKMTFQQPHALEWLLQPRDSGLSHEVLLTSLPLMVWNKDSDIRIRFRVATFNARLFHAIQNLGIYPSTLYTGIREYYNEIEVDQYEHILSRFLVLGSIIVASSSVRRGPYWHLIETCLFSSEYSSHIEAILAAVSNCLDLTPSSLFQAYASQMGYSMMKSSEGDIARIPPHLIGFDDRKQSASFALSAFAPTYIMSQSGPRFEAHCKLVDTSPEECFVECFGDIVGSVSAYWFQQHLDDGTEVQELESLLRETPYSTDFDEDFRNNADGVALAVIRSLSDQVIAPAGTIHKILKARGKANADTFSDLVKYRLNDIYDFHEPNLPAFSISVVIHTLSWLFGKSSTMPMKAMTYHILHGLFAAIHRSPVVNEQLRLVNALAVWISLRREDFDDATLLHTLIQGSTTLLAEPDLAHAAQSMLEWAFRLYEKQKLRDSAFSNIIIRICSVAYDYARSRFDDLQKLGNSLMEWIDKQAVSLSTAAVDRQVHRALPTWPYPPTPDLASIASAQSSESLAALLNDTRITYNKFRLVRRLYDHIRQGGELKAQFPKLDFWRLKDCIPGRTELQQEDIDAFASLLLVNHGDIGGITGEHRPLNSIYPAYRRVFTNKGDPAKNSRFIREIVTLSLLQQLDNHSSNHVFSAYETLRRIMAVLDNLEVHTGPSDYNSELGYLRAFPRRARPRSPCQLSEVLSLDIMQEATVNFNQWITVFGTKLSDCLAEYDPFFAQLSPILGTDADIARELLPSLIHGILRTEIADGKYKSKEYRRVLTDYLTSVLTSEHTNMTCRQSIIDTVLHLRQFNLLKDPLLSYNRWLNLDYRLLAKNAVLCGAYTTALLFLELQVDYPLQQSEAVISSENLLYEIYSHIDEPDGFYGIKTDDIHQFLARRYHHEKQWEKALQFHGATAEAEPGNTVGSDGLLQSFSSFGFSHLVMNTLRTSSTGSSSLDYRLGWRTETWDLPERKDFSTGSSLYFAVRAIHRERNPRTVNAVIHRGLSRTMDRLRSLGSENLTEIREIIREVMCLKQVSDWRRNATQSRLQKREIKIDDWLDLITIDSSFDFPDLETIMATRISLLHSARQKEEQQQIGNLTTLFASGLKELEKRCLIRLSQAARDANQVQIALNSVMRAHKLYPESSTEVSEEFANVLWEQGEQVTAIKYLQNVVRPLDLLKDCDTQTTTYRALLRARLGSWMATACLEKPTTIWAGYFRKAIQELGVEPLPDAESSRSRATVYHNCAVFAEQQYHAILKSPDAIRWKVYVDRKKQEVKELSMEMASARDTSRKQSLERDWGKARKILQEDSEQFRKHNLERDQFLQYAMEMFARSLAVADIYDDDAPIRFCSLWFANFDGGEDIQSTIGAALSRIPSYKMVFLAHQLTARLSSPTGELPKNQEHLQEMVLRMCREHPFHSIYQLYCLLPDRSTTSSRRQSGRLMTPTTPSTQTERGSAAQAVFERLRADKMIGDKVADIEQLCNACWEWAKYPLNKNQYKTSGKPYSMPSDLLICRLNDLRVPVSTVSTPLDPTLQYENCEWVQGFEKQFQTAGGINLPKISVCISSQNRRFKQLFKGDGNDDLRQDAVMEQVFDVVNAVLRRDRQTKRRELGVRGYKVIPLDSQSGLIEFVTDTIPLKNWLSAAHRKYRPRDMGDTDVRNRHDNARAAYLKDVDQQKLLQNFFEIRGKFRPVMRHYFSEKSKSPVTWFAMRLKYTRSVATTSIVGHVLGLGDRHTSNILLDNSSGEVVHIDLGIAFDQGKRLPVPERVPFRMTPDVVDGMGSSGTTGVFQRCAEETMRVLRDGSDVIMTVLEVFKHDPLHSWTLSERKVQNAQRSDRQQPQQGTSDNQPVNDIPRQAFGFGIGIDMSSGTAEEAADRALSSVARKLDKSLSVEYTVNQLIAEATDPYNLARIYGGWSPHH